MAWTTPHTAVLNEQLDASEWNSEIRDNLLETIPALIGSFGSGISEYAVTDGANSLVARQASRGYVSSQQATASTSYTDLSTAGPSVTLTTGTAALVLVQMEGSNSGTSTWHASWAVTGASSISADDSWSVRDRGAPFVQRTAAHLHTGLTAGSNTFKMKYKVLSGTGTYRYRRIAVIPFS